MERKYSECFSQWKEFLQLLKAPSEVDEVASSVARFINIPFLVNVWKSLLQEEEIVAVSEARRLLHGYRVVCNALCGKSCDVTHVEYAAVVVESFVSAVSEACLFNLSTINAVANCFSDLSLVVMAQKCAKDFCFPMFRSFDLNLLLRICKQSLLQLNEDSLLVFMPKLVDTFDSNMLHQFIECVLVKVPTSTPTIQVIVKCLPASCTLQVVESSSFIWSESQSSVAGKALGIRLHAGRCLVAALPLCPNEVIVSSTSRGVSTVGRISNGISCCFNSDNKAIQSLGMQVANSLASSLGHPAVFPDLPPTHTQSPNGSCESARDLTVVEKRFDDSGDSELESLDGTAEDFDNGRVQNPSNLLTCLGGVRQLRLP